MSAPYSAPQPAPQQPGPSGQSAGGPDLRFLLTLAVAGFGLVAYLLGFFDDQTRTLLTTVLGFSLIGAAALAGMDVLPKTPNTLLAAAPLSAYATLALLQVVIGGSFGVGGTSALVIVLLILAVLQLGAVTGVLLLDAGIIAAPAPKPAPPAPFAQSGQFGQSPQGQPGGWNPQSGGQAQPGQFGQLPPQGQPGGWGPQSGGQPQPGQYAQPPQPGQPQPGQPQPGGWNPQSGGFAAPGQYGQSPQPGQPGQQGQPGGPQGTQHMPHPNNPPRDH